jgi:uncharacterized protein YbjT (DUF2867 family)
MKIAVTGATGRVGHHVVDVLVGQGHDVVEISRAKGVDVITGDGLKEALVGVEAIVDTATGPSPDEQQATEFFATSARNLQEEGARAGVGRIVVVSIVGADRFSGGYNAAKVTQERIALEGPVPARILRATQFHEFVAQMVEWGTQGDVAYVPAFRTQLVAARTVAEELAAMVTDGTPTGPTVDLGGPREEQLVEAARLLVGDRLRVEEVYDESDPDAKLWADGSSLPGPDAKLGGPTFADWLATQAR